MVCAHPKFWATNCLFGEAPGSLLRSTLYEAPVLRSYIYFDRKSGSLKNIIFDNFSFELEFAPLKL